MWECTRKPELKALTDPPRICRTKLTRMFGAKQPETNHSDPLHRTGKTPLCRNTHLAPAKYRLYTHIYCKFEFQVVCVPGSGFISRTKNIPAILHPLTSSILQSNSAWDPHHGRGRGQFACPPRIETARYSCCFVLWSPGPTPTKQ